MKNTTETESTPNSTTPHEEPPDPFATITDAWVKIHPNGDAWVKYKYEGVQSGVRTSRYTNGADYDVQTLIEEAEHLIGKELSWDHFVP